MNLLASTKDFAADLPPAERILVTAHNLFYRDGIRATGIDRVIAESGVAKKTFYRYYPAKSDLIVAFLDYRHRNWMAWFEDAVKRHGGDANALVPTLAEWFGSEVYRGCAFINAVVEVGGTLPEAVDISQRHKRDMADVIRTLLPAGSRTAKADARALAMAVDGAIIGAQFEDSPDATLKSLGRVVKAIADPS
ncbi:TetR/AcrR family transcriptional regulator [Caballeronia sordidicola]|jgi:AcrR family transcriptional regulator|uniref:Transcriptional regulator, TetR family n=1 Tax=Caballeronia sordidicola TaxID=196367 RepID=A0A242MFP4_CABSO|nr:TetR/AcrR family transcriptional regulator [Caballeronia sordidicola]OTP70039.1 Transcriptional regulator, TetR family [Caballeronia sordidicola]